MSRIHSVQVMESGRVVRVTASEDVLDALAVLGGERLSPGTLSLSADDLRPSRPAQNERARAPMLAAMGPLVAKAAQRYLDGLDAVATNERHADHSEQMRHAAQLKSVAAEIAAAKATWAQWGLI